MVRDEIEIEVYVSTDRVGSGVTNTFTVDREDWDSMTELEKEMHCQDELWSMIYWGWEEK